MKKALLMIVALVTGDLVMGQLYQGGKAGMNYSIYGTKIDPEPSEKPETATGLGYHLGYYVGTDLSDNIGIRSELLYSARKTGSTQTSSSTVETFGTTTTTSTESDNKSTLNYIEVPVMLNYMVNDNFSFQAGLGLGLLLSSKTKSEATTTTTITTGGNTSSSTATSSSEDNSTENLNDLELGSVIGATYELESGLNFGLRYWHGLGSLNAETEFGGTTFKIKPNVIQFSIGYTFFRQ